MKMASYGQAAMQALQPMQRVWSMTLPHLTASLSIVTRERISQWSAAALRGAAGAAGLPCMIGSMTPKRCAWVNMDNPLMVDYHDREWGVPLHDDRRHF